MIANETPGWESTEVFLDGEKIEQCFEADDIQGKVWIHADNYQGYEVRYGKVEFKEKPAQVNMQSQTRGLLGIDFVKCEDPNCPYCKPSSSTGTINGYDGKVVMSDDLGYVYPIDFEYEWIDDKMPPYNYKLGEQFTAKMKPDRTEQVTGLIVNGDEITFDPVTLATGDTLQLSYEVGSDGMTINSVSIIRK